MPAKSLRLAAIQMVSENGHVAGNLARAAYWAEQAARQGAELVLLPELFSAGFELNARLWANAEPQNGPTERWLSDAAERHDFCIGGSFLERRGVPSEYCVFKFFEALGRRWYAREIRKLPRRGDGL